MQAQQLDLYRAKQYSQTLDSRSFPKMPQFVLKHIVKSSNLTLKRIHIAKNRSSPVIILPIDLKSKDRSFFLKKDYNQKQRAFILTARENGDTFCIFNIFQAQQLENCYARKKFKTLQIKMMIGEKFQVRADASPAA